jgi:hypothetical protein
LNPARDPNSGASTDTLGRRLERQARSIAARSEPNCSWAEPLAVLLDHLADLPAPAEGRFTRTEVGPGEFAPPRVAAAGRATPQEPRPAPWQQQPPDPATGGAGGGRPVPVHVAARLRSHAGPAAAALRVHDGAHANAVAAAHRADAVTVGADVYFRRGRYRPEEPAGFGLLVHEATHVVERFRPGAASRQPGGMAAAVEERAARAAEAAATFPSVPALPSAPAPAAAQPPALAPAAAVPAPSSGGPAAPAPFTPAAVPSTPAAPGPAAPAMAAPTDRPAAAAVDVDALRGVLMRDLMRQLRDEFERGG